MTLYLSNRDGDGKTNEEGHYRFQTAVWQGNVLGTNSLKVTENSPTGLSVLVATGDIKIDTDQGYSYTGWNTTTKTVVLSAADPANPRITSIVAYVDKDEDTSPSPPNNPGIIKLMAVNGTPSAVPSAPSSGTIQAQIGVGNPYVLLANITITAGSTTITNANIQDQRQVVTLGSNLVSESSIINGSVTGSKIATETITSTNIAPGGVSANNILTGAAYKPSELEIFYAIKSSNQTAVTNNAVTVITWQNPTQYKGSSNFSANGFIAPRNGWLLSTATVVIDGGTDADDTMSWRYYIDGVLYRSMTDNWRKFSTAGGVEYPTTLTAAIPVNAGQKVDIRYEGTLYAVTILGSAYGVSCWWGLFIPSY